MHTSSKTQANIISRLIPVVIGTLKSMVTLQRTLQRTQEHAYRINAFSSKLSVLFLFYSSIFSSITNQTIGALSKNALLMLIRSCFFWDYILQTGRKTWSQSSSCGFRGNAVQAPSQCILVVEKLECRVHKHSHVYPMIYAPCFSASNFFSSSASPLLHDVTISFG